MHRNPSSLLSLVMWQLTAPYCLCRKKTLIASLYFEQTVVMGCSSSVASLPSEPLKSKDGGSDLRTTDIMDWDMLQEKMGYNRDGPRNVSPKESRKLSNSENTIPQKRDTGETNVNFKVIKKEDKSRKRPKSKQKMNSTPLTLQEVEELEWCWELQNIKMTVKR